MTNKPLTCQYCGEDVPKPCFDAVGCRNILGKLTPEALCEKLNYCWRRTNRANIRVRYAGNGHYYQDGTGFTFHERRKDLEASLMRFQNRFAREEAERPAKEAADRELKARRYLELAAGEMYAALKAIAAQYEGQHIGPAGLAQVRRAIAKAEGREVVS